MIGGAERNAADFQIMASLRLLLAHEDLRPIGASWRCGQAALDLIPHFPAPPPAALPPVPAALPEAWLPAARRSRAAAARARGTAAR